MEKPVIFVFGVKRVFLSNNLHQVCLIFQALCLSEGFLVNPHFNKKMCYKKQNLWLKQDDDKTYLILKEKAGFL
jgi:hypothetical protein